MQQGTCTCCNPSSRKELHEHSYVGPFTGRSQGASFLRGDDYYKPEYWRPERYFTFQDRMWHAPPPHDGKVEVGEVEQATSPPAPDEYSAAPILEIEYLATRTALIAKAWRDAQWMAPKEGQVDVGSVEQVEAPVDRGGLAPR